MSIEYLNKLLQRQKETFNNKSPLFIFITGASGAEKSYLARALEQKLSSEFTSVDYFDRIGVPSLEDMIKEYGSCEKWQETMTHKWVEQLSVKKDKKIIILEGQFNPQFAAEACHYFGVSHYVLILLHANRKVRDHRLIIERAQPELANDTMNNWAEFLKHKTQEMEGIIIDTSDSNIHSNLDEIASLIEGKLHQMELNND